MIEHPSRIDIIEELHDIQEIAHHPSNKNHFQSYLNWEMALHVQAENMRNQQPY